MWGTEYALDDSRILGQIKELQAQGYVFIVSMGGALKPYLENSCTDVNALASVYNRILDTVGTTHLDLDLEAPVNQTLVNQAFAQVQRDKPDTTVSYTLLVRSANVGLTSVLGVDVLQNARENGVTVDIVNLLAMDFNRAVSSLSLGELIVTAATSVLKQLEAIWPEKSDAELKSMLGVTPMIGRNYNGGTFQISDAHTVVDWANINHIGFLSFWSGNRDAPCPGGATDVLSPDCSGIPQQDCEFTRIFQGFRSYLYEAVSSKGKHSNTASQKNAIKF